MKILIAGDNQNLAFLTKWMLGGEGYEAKSAQNGSDGGSTYLLFNPDLALRIFKSRRKMAWKLS